MIESTDLRTVALHLQELTGTSNAELARIAEVHRPNMLSWLAGKPQVLSEQNQLKVCEVLGWRYGRLRRDIVHRWIVGDELSTCRTFLANVETPKPDDEMWIFQAHHLTLPPAAIIISHAYNNDPLVILIARPLGHTLPPLITSESLGFGLDGKQALSISVHEWQECWEPKSSYLAVSKYLNGYGAVMRTYARRGGRKWAGLPPHDRNAPYEMAFDPFEALQWEDILDRAIRSGMSFEEVLARVKQVLGS